MNYNSLSKGPIYQNCEKNRSSYCVFSYKFQHLKIFSERAAFAKIGNSDSRLEVRQLA